MFVFQVSISKVNYMDPSLKPGTILKMSLAEKQERLPHLTRHDIEHGKPEIIAAALLKIYNGAGALDQVDFLHY